MNNVHRLAAGMTSLMLMLWVGPLGAQRPSENDISEGTNTGGGDGALANDNPLATNNTAYGNFALFSNGGRYNTAFGSNALDFNVGSFNTAVGAFSLRYFGGDQNTAVGFEALFNTDGGDSNAAVGFRALWANTTGFQNTAIGLEALRSNGSGSNNTAIGAFGLSNLGNNPSLLSGDLNIAIGRSAGQTLRIGNRNIYIGSSGPPSSMTTESDTIRIGGVQTKIFIAGVRNCASPPAPAGCPPPPGNSVPMLINPADGRLSYQGSSARYKRDIETMGTSSRGLLQLRPVTFAYKEDVQGERQYGLIAEEVAKVYPELVTRGAHGEVESVQYHELIPMLLNELQQQQQQQAELKAQNAALAGRLERLEAVTGAAAP